MNPYHHALSSVQKYGGAPVDYLPLHSWFDESKAYFPDIRHRALRHHAEGIFLAEQIFGPTITNSEGRVIPTRFLGEQHVKEDLGRIPTVQDWLACLMVQPWMLKAGSLPPGSDRLCERLNAGECLQEEPCECQQPGVFHSGVPGILARIENGRVAAEAKVERCDLCQRYPSDEAVFQKLADLSMA